MPGKLGTLWGEQRGQPAIDEGVEPALTLCREWSPAYQRGVTLTGNSGRRGRPCDPHLDTLDLHARDLGESGRDRAAQELDLRGPCRLVGLHDQHPFVETDGSDVCGDRRADRFIPAAEDAPDLDPVGPAQRLHDGVERPGDRNGFGHAVQRSGQLGSTLTGDTTRHHSQHVIGMSCRGQLAGRRDDDLPGREMTEQ